MRQLKNNYLRMNKVLIIAEAGVNHNGSIEMAKKLIDVAVNAGVDYVKFQTFNADTLVLRSAKKAEYQQKNMSKSNDSQYQMLKNLELSKEQHGELLQYCNSKGIKFLSTPFDLESIDYLDTLNLDFWKIPSGEITNYPYLKKIALKGKPVVLSTGMCDLNDIQNALDVLQKFGLKKEHTTLLHCNTEYPTPMEDVNLLAMKTLAHQFGLNVGYSDHTQGIQIPIAAVALGACVIEKHFTLDKQLEGPDHKASIEPNELVEMVIAIRSIEKAIGTGEKKVSKSEQKNIVIARKSIVAAAEIKVGELFSDTNLTVKRPGSGISPMLWEEIIGKPATYHFQPDDLIHL